MKKLELIFTIVVFSMLTAIIILCYQIPGTDRVALWCIVVPFIVLRFVKSILQIRVQKSFDKDLETAFRMEERRRLKSKLQAIDELPK